MTSGLENHYLPTSYISIFRMMVIQLQKAIIADGTGGHVPPPRGRYANACLNYLFVY